MVLYWSFSMVVALCKAVTDILSTNTTALLSGALLSKPSAKSPVKKLGDQYLVFRLPVLSEASTPISFLTI
ncbi:hypothetical protein F5Y04DRAFT_260082 [Hypomontagnella monticulosa]|nr:hypothetical protein F5Y04DRAFT_260082 [Hypomontagnella monticulosa]